MHRTQAAQPDLACTGMNALTGVDPNDKAIEALAGHMVDMPEAVMEDRMYFADGLAARELWRAAGTAIIGMKHKKDSIAFLLSGSMRVWDKDNGPRDIHAPATWVRPAGTQQVSLALTDSLFTCVHATEGVTEDEVMHDVIDEDSINFKRRFEEARAAKELAS